MRRKWKFLMSVLLAATIIFRMGITVSAINTVFDVAEIDPNAIPDNVLYQSPNLNIISAKWSYGLTANILNTSNLDTLIAELNANVSPAGYSRSVLGIYPNGANLSDSNAQAIRSAGWTEVTLYYETFLVSGSAPESGMTPSVAKTEDEDILSILTGAGCADNAVVVDVSGINMQWSNIIVYDEEFAVLKGNNCYAYKYIGDIGRFVPLAECYYGSYGAYFLEIYDLQNAEDDVNGRYVVVTQQLPSELVTTKEELPALRESLQQVAEEAVATEEAEASERIESPDVAGELVEEISPKEPEAEAESVVELVLSNTEETVEWQFGGGQAPENFVAEATVVVVNQAEVSVDFAYSGELPDNTEVTIAIPDAETDYQDGDTLYLYYCNPDTNQREYAGEGVYQDGLVTFPLEHCSQYIITSVNHGESYATGGQAPLVLIYGLVGLAVSCGVGVLIYLVARKRK